MRLRQLMTVSLACFLVVSCELLEEPASSNTPAAAPPNQQRPTWTRLTTEQVGERWQVFPGSSAPPVSAVLRPASSTDVFDEAGFTVSDARRYGRCDVFSLHLQGSYANAAVMDCVDENADNLPGHYHTAVVCAVDWNVDHNGDWYSSYYDTVLVRAGRQTYYLVSGLYVVGQIGDIEHSFLWQATAEVRDYSFEGIAVYEVVDVYWGYHTTPWPDNHLHDHFESKVGHPDGLHFHIGRFGGRVKFLENDDDALKEYQSRCDEDLLETEPTGPGRGPIGEPGN